jgi:hypothetical protein
MPLPLLLLGAAALGAGGYGASKLLGGSSAKSDLKAAQNEQEALINNKPQYTEPSQIDEILAIEKARMAKTYTLPEFNLSTKMPGYEKAVENIYGGTAGAIRNVKEASASTSGTLGAIVNAYGNQNTAVSNLDIEAERYAADIEKQKLAYDINKENTLYNREVAGEQAYVGALGTKADYADKAWNWNVGQTYIDQYNRLTQEQENANARMVANRQMVGNIVGGGLNLVGSIVKAAS